MHRPAPSFSKADLFFVNAVEGSSPVSPDGLRAGTSGLVSEPIGRVGSEIPKPSLDLDHETVSQSVIYYDYINILFFFLIYISLFADTQGVP